MAVYAVAGHSSNEGQGQEQEANHFIPQGMKRPDYFWYYVPDEFDAVLYERAFGHNIHGSKFGPRALISRRLPVDRSIIAA
jgi:hypothetical protein